MEAGDLERKTFSAVGIAISRGRLFDCARREMRVLGRPPPKSIALEDEVLFIFLADNPKDALFAEGDDGDEGDPLTRPRRLFCGRAEGATGDAQKNAPRLGEPPNEDVGPKAGDCWDD